MKGRRPFVLNTRCARMFDRDCGMGLSCFATSPFQGSTDSTASDPRASALGCHSSPFQGSMRCHHATGIWNLGTPYMFSGYRLTCPRAPKAHDRNLGTPFNGPKTSISAWLSSVVRVYMRTWRFGVWGRGTDTTETWRPGFPTAFAQ